MQTELARSYLERKIDDPELRAKLTPDYPVGCKRPLISREWFPALTRPNVRLVTEPIVEITEAGCAPPTARSTASTRSSTAPASGRTST